MQQTADVLPGRIAVQTQGGQLSRTTLWTLLQNGAELCRIEQVNWKWKFWSYQATIHVGGQRIEASSAVTGNQTVVSFVDSSGLALATETDQDQLMFRDQRYRLDGIGSPDRVLDASGRPLLTLHWSMQTLAHIDVAQPLPAELVAVAAAACAA